MTKRLIVTADDVALHRGMTDGAIRAHQEGIVTACSIVANGAAFEHAIERLRDVPTSFSARVCCIVGANGLFSENYAAFVTRYAARRVRMDDVERELRTQIERVLQTGLTITHANGHQHLHLLPRIFDIVQRLADEYRIGYVRIVDEPRSYSARGAALAVLTRLVRRARKRAQTKTNDRTIGITRAGHLHDIVALLDRVEGTTELVCHPGIDDRALAQSYEWNYEWDAETRALCDPNLRDAIAARGIELVAPNI